METMISFTSDKDAGGKSLYPVENSLKFVLYKSLKNLLISKISLNSVEKIRKIFSKMWEFFVWENFWIYFSLQCINFSILLFFYFESLLSIFFCSKRNLRDIYKFFWNWIFKGNKIFKSFDIYFQFPIYMRYWIKMQMRLEFFEIINYII